MNSLMIISKIDMVTNRDYYSQILTALCIKLKLKMFKTILVTTKYVWL